MNASVVCRTVAGSHFRHRRLLPFLMLAVPALIPVNVRADSIDFPIVAGIGIVVGVPLLAFNVAVEGAILSRFIRLPFSRVWRPTLAANVWSLLAGFPVTIVNAFLAETFLPDEMVKRMASYPVAVCFAVLNYLLATVVVEWFVLRRRVTPNVPLNPRRALFTGVCVGQLASYAALGPLFGMYAMPKQGVQSFTANTRWASQPATPLIYVSPHGGLQSVLTDGSGARPLLTNEVRDFVVSDDYRTILFRGASNHYFMARGSGVQLVCSERLVCYGQGMDFSPTGRFIALLDDSASVLWVRDTQSGRIRKGAYAAQERYFVPVLVWSTNENTFYVAELRRASKLTIHDDQNEDSLQISEAEQKEVPYDLAQHYTRFGQGHDRDQDNWDVRVERFSKDEDRSIIALSGLTSYVRASTPAGSLMISDNPGVFHLGRRNFNQAAFCANGAEMVFDDRQHIYLASIAERKVGLIAAGSRFVIPLRPFAKPHHLRFWLAGEM